MGGSASKSPDRGGVKVTLEIAHAKGSSISRSSASALPQGKATIPQGDAGLRSGQRSQPFDPPPLQWLDLLASPPFRLPTELILKSLCTQSNSSSTISPGRPRAITQSVSSSCSSNDAISTPTIEREILWEELEGQKSNNLRFPVPRGSDRVISLLRKAPSGGRDWPPQGPAARRARR